MKKDDIIKIINDDNEEKEYVLLATFIDSGKQYIIYKDINNNSIDKDIMASRIDEFKVDMKLFPLSNEEWDMIIDKYKKIINKN